MRTVVGLAAGSPRARVSLVGGAVVPRLVERDARSARVALVAGGALLLAGDRVKIEVTVGGGCTLDLEDVGGTVAYGGDPGTSSGWHAVVRVGRGATLTWHGLPLVVSAGADVTRTLDLELDEGAAALLRDTTVLGRHGQPPGRYAATTTARLDGRPLLVEQLEPETLPLPGITGGARVLDVVTALGYRPRTTPGALALERPGALVRHLGPAAHRSTLASTWADWRADLAVRELAADDPPRYPTPPGGALRTAGR